VCIYRASTKGWAEDKIRGGGSEERRGVERQDP